MSQNLVISSVAVDRVNLNENSHFVIDCSINQNSQSIPSLALIDSGASAYGFINTKLVRNHNLKTDSLPYSRSLKVFDGTESVSGKITHVAHVTLQISGHSESILLFVTSLAYFDIVLGLPWLQFHDPTINWAQKNLLFKGSKCRLHSRNYPVLVNAVTRKRVLERRILKDIDKNKSFFKSFDVNSFDESDSDNELNFQGISVEDIEEALREKPRVDPATILPKVYHEYLRVFSKDEADRLPPHRPSDHRIILKSGSEAPWGPLYGMSREELMVLKKYIRENLEKGFIRPSTSPASSPVLFVKKPGGGLRFCVDYRALNDLTIKNRYPIPRIHETLTLLGKAKFFTKLDVISAFHRMRIAEGDEYLTAFRTRFGLYEYLVMPFGLANAPSSFQNYINDTLKGYLDEFCTAYIDDILIFSQTLDEHHDHVKKVLKRLFDAGLQIDIKKCEFHVTSVKFLGLIITTEGIKMDPSKLESIQNWPAPGNTKDIHRFIGFLNFYRRFIKNFGSIVMPLTDLMKKDVPFAWGPREILAFKNIKQKFKEDVALQHFNWDKPARLETDASDRGTGGVLLQPDEMGNWKPVAFFSRKMSPAEANYEIYDKELLAIVQAFEEWRPELEGSPDAIEVITDHKALEYFMKSRLLSRRQARWSEFLSRFNFKICYRPGSQNGIADVLSRPIGEEDPSVNKFLEQRVLKPHNLSPGMCPMGLLANDLEEINSIQESLSYPDSPSFFNPEKSNLPLNFVERIKRTTLLDETLLAVIKALHDDSAPRVRNFTLSECLWKDEILYYRGSIVVPQSKVDLSLATDIIQSYHDPPAAGHQGAAATYSSIARKFFWHGMLQQVRRYVRNCHTCSRTKPSREGNQGLLRPLPIATERWRHVALDFITDLPPSEDWSGNIFNSILVVVDRMTKQVHIIPCNDLSTRNTAYLFYREIFRLHGLPDSIVSDRGTQFTSEFWKWLCKLLQIDHRLSTAYHPQTDGQTERMNGRIEQHLRSYVNFVQNNWVLFLPSAEFAINNHNSKVTGLSPFFAVYGLHPRSGSELSPPLCSPPAPASTYFERLSAEDILDKCRRINEFMIQNLQFHSAECEAQANKSRYAARNFKTGNMVWLNLKNVKSLRPSRKLDYKNAGPFKILESIGKYAFKLDLPKSMKIHPVFHVSLLSPVAQDALPGQISGPVPPLEVLNEEPEYEIERVVGSMWQNGQIHYIVRWKGYGPEDDWTIPASESKGFRELVDSFHELNPTEPHPAQPTPATSKRNSKFRGKKVPRRSSARIRGG